MLRADQVEVPFRIVVEQPVPGVPHSLQDDDRPLDPKRSTSGESLEFDFPVRIGPGPKYFGRQVRREGAVRRFVYVRIGQMAGDAASPWSRRMKIDIHDLPQDMLDRALAGEGIVEIVVNGTGKDGTPACATVTVVRRRIV